MTKLVVTYTTSNGVDSWTTVACAEYESLEAFYIDLEQKIHEYVKDGKIYSEKLAAWGEKMQQAKMRVHNARKPQAVALAEKEAVEVSQQRPSMVLSEISVGGIVFPLDGVTYHSDAGETIVSMPEIQTLEEWFQSKVAD